MSRLRFVWLLCLFLVVALAACRAPAPVDEADGDPVAARVQARPLAELLLPAQPSAPAQVLAPNESVLSAELSAPVLRVRVDVGSVVAEGDVLLELDATDARLMQAQARARLTAAQARNAQFRQRLERARTLAERSFIAADDLNALEAEFEAAQAEVEVARADHGVAARSVDKSRVQAPFAGVVVERHAQVGALAVAGTPLLRLIDLAPAEIEANLQEAEAERFDDARSLLFESQGRQYPVHLLRMVPVVERQGRTRIARFGFNGESAPAGSSGRLRWELPARQLPARLLVRRDDALGVFTVATDRARFVPVPGAHEGRPFEVDLPPQSRVIVEGHQGLNDGDLIEVADRSDDASD